LAFRPLGFPHSLASCCFLPSESGGVGGTFHLLIPVGLAVAGYSTTGLRLSFFQTTTPLQRGGLFRGTAVFFQSLLRFPHRQFQLMPYLLSWVASFLPRLSSNIGVKTFPPFGLHGVRTGSRSLAFHPCVPVLRPAPIFMGIGTPLGVSWRPGSNFPASIIRRPGPAPCHNLC